MKPKHIMTLSVLAGLAAVVLVQLQLRGERGRQVTLFRATEALAPGTTLAGRIETVTLPGDKLFPNLLKEAPTADMREYVASAPLRETIEAGDLVLYRHLEASADPGLKGLIPAGHRAFSIEVDGASSVAFLVQPEDRVDVIGTVPDTAGSFNTTVDQGALGSSPGFDPTRLQQALTSGDIGPDLLGMLVGAAPTGSPRQENRRTETLLQDVEVLAVGRRFRRGRPSRRGDAYDTVTLLLSPEQAQELAYARDVQGSPMTLVLRGLEIDPAAAGVAP